jgi:hypothetical protein
MENEIKKQVVSRFVKENAEMITACFDEYYFIIAEGLIKPVPINAGTYHLGEKVPVKGETYQFPDDFNIIDLHYQMVAKIRDAKFCDLIPLETYEYDNYPALNMMGFAVKLNAGDDFVEFKRHFTTFSLAQRNKLAEFANRWFEITRYRKIKYQ